MTMISVEEALEHVGSCARQLSCLEVPLREALGLRLAEPAVSTVDSPPFDKSMLDGYAVSVEDPAPTRSIAEEVIAGGVPQHPLGGFQSTEQTLNPGDTTPDIPGNQGTDS